MVFLLPGDPIAALAGDKALSPAVAAQLRARYHLDQPFLMQYFLYLKGIFTLDFGTSFSGRPVSEVLAQAFPITIKLSLMALAIEGIFGIGFGLFAGLRKGGIFDSSVLLVSLVIIAIPIFVIGFLAQFLHRREVGAGAADGRGKHQFQESAAARLRPRVGVVRVRAPSHADVGRREPHRRLRENRDGQGSFATPGGAGARAAELADPVVTFLGADLATLMGGAIVTEGIFNINGVGGTIYQAVTRGEAPTVVSFVTVLIVIYLLANLIVDLLYAALDPRIRYV